MNTYRKLRVTLYKEALGIPGVDGILTALEPDRTRVVIMRMEAQHNGHHQFESMNPDVMLYATENQVSLMMRGIRVEIVCTDVFEVGDTVKFKSGGPVMTVSKVDNEAKTADLLWNAIGMNGCVSCAFKVPFACLVPADPPA